MGSSAQQVPWMNEPKSNSKYSAFTLEGLGCCLILLGERWAVWLDDCSSQEVIPVTLMATMSVGTALAVCLIFSSGVGRGATLFHTTCPSTSDPSPPSPTGVWGLMESWDLSSSTDEAVDWIKTTERQCRLTSHDNRKTAKRECRKKDVRNDRSEKRKRQMTCNWDVVHKENQMQTKIEKWRGRGKDWTW